MSRFLRKGATLVLVFSLALLGTAVMPQAAGASTEPFLGEIQIFAFEFAPKGWLQCNGQLLPINQNQALFALLGTTYGGDGRVNFALPDLRGRIAIHTGNGHTLGERGGEQAHSLNLAELPAHVHAVPAGLLSGATGTYTIAQTLDRRPINLHGPGTGDGYPWSVEMLGNVGGSQAHFNMQPFLTLNFCIAIQGIFPSPN